MGRSRPNYHLWTAEEEALLKEGVRQFGPGQWEIMRQQYPGLRRRSGVQLKDKWRNLVKYRHLTADERAELLPGGSGSGSPRQAARHAAAAQQRIGLATVGSVAPDAVNALLQLGEAGPGGNGSGSSLRVSSPRQLNGPMPDELQLWATAVRAASGELDGAAMQKTAPVGAAAGAAAAWPDGMLHTLTAVQNGQATALPLAMQVGGPCANPNFSSGIGGAFQPVGGYRPPLTSTFAAAAAVAAPFGGSGPGATTSPWQPPYVGVNGQQAAEEQAAKRQRLDSAWAPAPATAAAATTVALPAVAAAVADARTMLDKLLELAQQHPLEQPEQQQDIDSVAEAEQQQQQASMPDLLARIGALLQWRQAMAAVPADDNPGSGHGMHQLLSSTEQRLQQQQGVLQAAELQALPAALAAEQWGAAAPQSLTSLQGSGAPGNSRRQDILSVLLQLEPCQRSVAVQEMLQHFRQMRPAGSAPDPEATLRFGAANMRA